MISWEEPRPEYRTAATACGYQIDHGTEDGERTLCGQSVHVVERGPWRPEQPFACRNCARVARRVAGSQRRV